jgi:Tol biopolymer transport system component/DNA-binding winged helix-turn-helix (wHTH) protein
MKNAGATRVARVGDASTGQVAYEFAGFRLEPARRSLTRPDGTPARLSGKPFDTLVYLVERSGELVDRDELLRSVWPKRVIEDNNLNQTIATLRRVLGEQHVVTVPGRGYQFVTPVRRLPLARPSGESEPSAPAEAAPKPAAPETVGADNANRRNLRWPILIAAAAAGVAVAALLALGPLISPSTSLAGASVELRPLTAYPGQELSPAISPDGTRVAFSWQGPTGGRRIYVTQVAVAQPVRLSEVVELGADTDPAWSPDGQWIAFLRRYDPMRFEIMLMPALGGEARKVAGGEMYSVSVEGTPLLAWTPDSRQLLFTTLRAGQPSRGSYGLHRLTLATGAVEDLGLDNDTLDYDTSPAVSRDGRWLAFTRFTRTGRLNRVVLQRLGPGYAPAGAPEPAPDISPDIYHSLHWNPNSDRLWFTDGTQILEWRLGGSPRSAVTLGARFTRSALSIVATATGARAAVVEHHQNSELFALHLDPSTHRAIGEAEPRAESTTIDYHPRISPDGKTLAFVSDRSGAREIWLANRDGTNPRQLTRVGQLIVGYPRWSPDSRYIAFHSSAPGRSRVIYRVEVESGATKLLFDGCCPGGWSADRQHLYVTAIGDVNYIERVNIETGARERLVEGETATESHDGKFLLFSRARDPGYFRWPLHAASGHADAERLVADYMTSSAAIGGIAPVVDGFYYVAVTEDATPRAIRFYDYASSEAQDVAAVPPSTAIGLTVSPEGNELLYAAIGEPQANLVLLEVTLQE